LTELIELISQGLPDPEIFPNGFLYFKICNEQEDTACGEREALKAGVVSRSCKHFKVLKNTPLKNNVELSQRPFKLKKNILD